MSEEAGFINSETNRRVYNMCRIGNIHSVHSVDATAKVEFDGGEIVSDFIPWITGASGDIRIHRRPTVGEQVMVLAPSGDINGGVILCGISCDAFPINGTDPKIHRIDYPDGGYTEYDFDSGDMKVHAMKDIQVSCGQNATVTAGTQITLNSPEVNISGNLTLTASSSAIINAPSGVDLNGDLRVTGDVIAGGVSLRHHIHYGDDGGNTSEPQV